MKKIFAGLAFLAVCIGFFSFAALQQQKRTPLPFKWFKYRTGEMGVPTADATNAKVDSYYSLEGDDPYCGGAEDFCGLYAEPSDNTPNALPIIDGTIQSDIDNYFSNPGTYSGSYVDRTID